MIPRLHAAQPEQRQASLLPPGTGLGCGAAGGSSWGGTGAPHVPKGAAKTPRRELLLAQILNNHWARQGWGHSPKCTLGGGRQRAKTLPRHRRCHLQPRHTVTPRGPPEPPKPPAGGHGAHAEPMTAPGLGQGGAGSAGGSVTSPQAGGSAAPLSPSPVLVLEGDGPGCLEHRA